MAHSILEGRWRSLQGTRPGGGWSGGVLGECLCDERVQPNLRRSTVASIIQKFQQTQQVSNAFHEGQLQL